MNDSGSKYFFTPPPRYKLESARNLVSSFDSCENGILYLLNTKTGKYTYISRSVAALSGYSLGNFEKRGLVFFLSIIHPHDYPRVLQEFMAMDVAGSRPGTLSSTFEFRARHASSGWLWLENYAFLVETEDGIPHIFGTMKEISERKIKESFLWRELKKREKCPDSLKKLTEQYQNLTRSKPGSMVPPNEIMPGDPEVASGQVSNREMEVLKLIADGLSSKELASVLNISTHTVISHRKHLLEKFQVKNTAELIKVAFKSFLMA